jgi:hypothetical protein
MDDLAILTTVIWAGSFAVVAVDSVARGISPWFWRFASLFGGPLALLAYGIVRELSGRQITKG